jgi:hypothetical protein
MHSMPLRAGVRMVVDCVLQSVSVQQSATFPARMADHFPITAIGLSCGKLGLANSFAALVRGSDVASL